MSALHNLLIHIHKPMHIHVLHVLIPASYDGSVRLPPPPFLFLVFLAMYVSLSSPFLLSLIKHFV